MHRARSYTLVGLTLSGALALSACAVAPAGPSSAAMPGTGKSFDAFRYDDQSCRQYADQQIGNVAPGKAAADSGVASAAVGTALGAAAGALIGSTVGAVGAGAAIGAGSGLLLGSAVGANNAAVAGGSQQARYDGAYNTCMFGKGNTVMRNPGPPPYAVMAPSYAYYAPGFAQPTYYYGY